MRDLNDFYYIRAGRSARWFFRRHQIRALEKHLHTRLIQRSSRHFKVPETGSRFYEHSVARLDEVDLADRCVAELQSEPCGVIRLSCPVALLNFQFGALLARFMQRYPAVTLHLESTNRRVDVLKEGFDLAIRVRFPPLETWDLVMRVFDTSTRCLVAAPQLVGRL